ncbi:MAG: hypothetical protein AAF587_10305 [Bacteroidota bacterium]
MNKDLLRLAIRQNAIVIMDEDLLTHGHKEISETTSILVANCIKLGYNFSEELLHRINGVSPIAKLELFEVLKDVTGVNKNWTPLTKKWNIPTGESVVDHFMTLLANVFQTNNGTRLTCGHIIPDQSFPLDRYNGCPFCGTPFERGELDYEPGRNKLTTLELWTKKDLKTFLASLLASPVALDATQVDNLKMLLTHLDLPTVAEVRMKETQMLVIDTLLAQAKAELAGRIFKTPQDILRYLWYKHTGFLQLVEPKVIAKRIEKNSRNRHRVLDNRQGAKIQALSDLKLKFSRAECRQYALWLNQLSMPVAKQCEIMHPKRSMWVRVIRALRLAEYSKKKGFEQLAELLDRFYNERYEVWQGQLNLHKLKVDEKETFRLLKQRPGLFARSLFSTMLWFGPDLTIQHFKEVMGQVPARLIFTLNMYAETYFDKETVRVVKPLGGTTKRIPANKMLKLYTVHDLRRMQSMIEELSLDVIKENFAKANNPHERMFIQQDLFNIPIAIGDRNEQLQDLPGALMGTIFKVEGDTVRLFLQWGEGLEAQHLDMDLSCKVAYDNREEFCSYAQLSIPACKHSGDIQRIPSKVGTAEYIDIDLAMLTKRDARQVIFTCNAYTNGSLSPNLIVGWMNSQFRMKISQDGVAYDPTAVQHQIRIQRTLTKGLVFGVLKVKEREIVWLEVSFGGQRIQNMSVDTVNAYLEKLEAKPKIGELLQMKADIQGLTVVENPDEADEVYDLQWAMNTAAVSRLFLAEKPEPAQKTA